VEIAEHIEALREQGTLLAAAAAWAGLGAAVPACPSWQVRDLLRHTGYVHRWAARHIAERPSRVLDGPGEAEILRGGPPDPGLLDWFRAGHAALVETLESADPGLSCATFLPAPSPLGFWARRQAHETAIHRADADGAAGVRPGYPPALAADGVDELVMGFGQRRAYRPAAAPGGGMLVRATDTGDAWRLTVADGRFVAHRAAGGPGAGDEAPGPGDEAPRPGDEAPRPGEDTVTGPAAGLYLFLWNRSDAATAGVRLGGDGGFLAAWRSSVRVRWT
jgi:uncharacterized protein (TIGR03083 family)